MMLRFHRRSFLFSSLSIAVLPVAGLAAPKPPVVLFVCEFGTAKSAIAREMFRRRARERGIAVTAFSRGLKIEDHISPPLRTALDAEGIDSRRDGFAVIAARDVRRADVIVAFTSIPATFHPRDVRDWSALPSVNDSWPVAHAELARRIDALLDSIAGARPK
jgi:protein-tyrosine-phosphatase